MTADMNGQKVDTDPPTYQQVAHAWALHCFGSEIVSDTNERCARFLEEALELVQALGLPKDHAVDLVEYVYGRPPGRPSQEVGGVSLTLAVLCGAVDLDMLECSIQELRRVQHPDMIDRIRRKNATKPRNSPLPGGG